MPTFLQSFFYALSAFVFLIGWLLLKRNFRSLKDIRGPSSPSVWLGNLSNIRYENEVGDNEFPWMKEFGGAWRIKGILGEDHLMLADAKAFQYIFQTSGYRFFKPNDYRTDEKMMLGPGGIGSAHGDVHQRHRRIMNPSFSTSQLKSFLPMLLQYSAKVRTSTLATKLKEGEFPNSAVEATFNIYPWLARATLDIISDAGFALDVGALDNSHSPLHEAYDGIFLDSTMYPHAWNLVFRTLWRYVPIPILLFVRYMPSREYTRFRQFNEFMRKYARNVILPNSQAKLDSKDMMSVLIRANEAESPRMKLAEFEVLDQISTILFAGHETTALSLTWWLWELAKYPEYQERIREEIVTARAKVSQRGATDFSASDLEEPLACSLFTVLQEALRLHPIVWHLKRAASQDDVIPLAVPVVGKSGKMITEIPVKKGQLIDLSVAAYNRNPDVWGPDAAEWRPERFLGDEQTKMTAVGMHGNIMTFSAGVQSCIGWRFGILTMQAISVALLENFEFHLPPNAKDLKIARKPANAMPPMVEGKPEMGIWMGLTVKSLST
ncbi:cytochrome P450 [Vararia minispora EC-137]|uniref:Cytochrome P450 n=1 Tax=Vararia minispora EC-137 TaxID=1314806 RepID=A0ACB8QYD7_9AGAM|nr:cytochrome P450 [Vararia minispora EC-137]